MPFLKTPRSSSFPPLPFLRPPSLPLLLSFPGLYGRTRRPSHCASWLQTKDRMKVVRKKKKKKANMSLAQIDDLTN